MGFTLISATPYAQPIPFSLPLSSTPSFPSPTHPHSSPSDTRSPYARKVRIALLEKSIPFTLQTEVPWNSSTCTPQHNPLEKLPVLIDTSTDTSVYESHFILEWLEAHYGREQGYAAMFPEGKAQELLAKQVQVVADGMCDACVLMFVRCLYSFLHSHLLSWHALISFLHSSRNNAPSPRRNGRGGSSAKSRAACGR